MKSAASIEQAILLRDAPILLDNMKVSKDFLSTSHFKAHSLNVGDIDNEYSISSVVGLAKNIDTRKKYRYFDAIRYCSFMATGKKKLCVWKLSSSIKWNPLEHKYKIGENLFQFSLPPPPPTHTHTHNRS